MPICRLSSVFCENDAQDVYAAIDEVVVAEACRLYGDLRQNACARRLLTSAAGRACCHHATSDRRQAVDRHFISVRILL